eukprot:1505088-Amphidinium_carterae.1
MERNDKCHVMCCKASVMALSDTQPTRAAFGVTTFILGLAPVARLLPFVHYVVDTAVLPRKSPRRGCDV